MCVDIYIYIYMFVRSVRTCVCTVCMRLYSRVCLYVHVLICLFVSMYGGSVCMPV